MDMPKQNSIYSKPDLSKGFDINRMPWLDEGDNKLFPVFNASDAFQELSEIRYIVNDLIAEGSLTLLVGEPGSKKTFAMLSLCACVAAGIDWANHTTTKSPTLYVDEESGRTRLLHRVKAVMNGYDLTAEQVNRFHLICGQGFNIRTTEGVSQFEQLINWVKPRLVVLDALADVIPGSDENSVKDIQPPFMALKKLAEKFGTAIIVIHHTNKSGGYRGSSAMKGSVDVLLTVESDDRRNTVNFSSEKVRDGEPVNFSAIAQFGEDSFFLESKSTTHPGKFSPSQERVIQAVKASGRLTIKGIETITGIPHETVKKAVKDLQALKVFVRVDAGGKGSEGEYGLFVAE